MLKYSSAIFCLEEALEIIQNEIDEIDCPVESDEYYIDESQERFMYESQWGWYEFIDCNTTRKEQEINCKIKNSNLIFDQIEHEKIEQNEFETFYNSKLLEYKEQIMSRVSFLERKRQEKNRT